VLYEHVQLYDILPKEQYAVRRGRRGCLDALLIDSMVAREAKLRRRSLSVAWIDYWKAYHRVPHEWIQFLLQDISAPVVVGHIVGNLIRLWQTVFSVRAGKDAVKVELTYLRRLFQGDSLSPLLYCLSIAPLSMALRGAGGVQVGIPQHCGKPPVLHGRCEGFAKDSKELGNTLKVVDEVSQAIGRKLGLRKCAVAHIERGKLVEGKIISWMRKAPLNVSLQEVPIST